MNVGCSMIDSGIIQKLEDAISNLSREEKLALLQKLTNQLEGSANTSESISEFRAVYGSGRGLWDDLDAQEYVNSLRQDRL